ncbi:uncharacterized protein LOC134854837 [Symsagittifera roscoffensis]|uniref:uncharacterized protein LOC134854837 n=1 Tax=Symsagittifera roscoffensis TaxID=84072 RepID=UPI00307C08EA
MSSPASDMSNVTLTLPALKRSRSANIGVITRSENAVSAIFNKEASALTYKEIGTLKANLTMCERKKKELEELNQQISNVLNDDEDALEVELEEAEKIYLQVDCLMEMITTMLDDRGKYSTESVKDDDSASGTGSYKSTSQRGAGRNQDTCLKLPKLNSPTFSGRRQWELSCVGSDVPKIKQMKKFLEERSRALEATKDLQLPSIHRKNRQGNSDQSGNSKKDDKVQTYHTNSAKTIICPCCSGDHRVYQCTKFQEMSISNRRQEAKSKRLCFNCLSLGHQNHECKSKSTCQTCRKGHHSLLHIHTDPNKQPGPENKFAGHGGTTGATTILGTVLIEVKTANGGYHNCRALLDSGSECSFVTTSCANRLKLPIKKLTLQLTRVGGGAKTVKAGSVNLETKDSQNQSLHIEAFTLQKLSGYLPRERETAILQNGRFTMQLPFKPNSQLGDNLAQAKRRFNYLERRLEQNPELKDRYTAFIDELLDMGHMEYIPPGEIEKPVDSVYYLPHHCVFKEDSTTTKLRVVFDRSATTSTGQSLNDTLMVSPTVQDDLYSIIMRFRFYPNALSADIAKMYRQVALEDKSKDFHRILEIK